MVDKAEVWRERLAACRASGRSTAAFCRERGLSYAQYMYWQHRVGKQVAGWVPVRVEARTQVSAGWSLELTLAQGATLRIVGASVSDVVTLVRGLSC